MVGVTFPGGREASCSRKMINSLQSFATNVKPKYAKHCLAARSVAPNAKPGLQQISLTDCFITIQSVMSEHVFIAHSR